MSITGVNSYSSILSIADLYGTQDTDSVSSDDMLFATTGSSSVLGSDSLNISKPAEIYSKLQELAQSDPEKLKEVCADIAQKLKSASESETGQSSKMLSDLADKFQSVADGGDVSELKPPEPPSFSDETQRPIDKYSKQQDAQMIGFMSGQGSQSTSGSDGEELLSSILDELDKALSS